MKGMDEELPASAWIDLVDKGLDKSDVKERSKRVDKLKGESF